MSETIDRSPLFMLALAGFHESIAPYSRAL
jgi:hypothetical protein